MGLFDFFKNSGKPYKEEHTNLIYQLLFCDQLELFKSNHKEPDLYPWNILFSATNTAAELQEIAQNPDLEARSRLLAYHKMQVNKFSIPTKELLGVIVEVGLDDGLDVLASFRDGSARYINYTGKIIIWETATEESNLITQKLFTESEKIVKKIGPWDQPRKPAPVKGSLRLSFLVSDGLYFGEGPMNVLFNDPMAAPALYAATELMQYLTKIG